MFPYTLRYNGSAFLVRVYSLLFKFQIYGTLLPGLYIHSTITCNTIQWNPYIADTIGELHVGHYRGLAVAEGFYKYYMNEIRT